MEKKQNYNELKNLSINQGMMLFGVADIRKIRENFLLPQNVVNKLDSAISIGYRLSSSVLETITDAPNQIYYFHYQRVNILLDQTALKIISYIQDKGYDALPIAASQVIDWQKQLGCVSHREIAYYSGHGWYGKNNLLVNPKFGSQIRYATVLTNIPLDADAPVSGNCGNCKHCIDVCPANAISENNFDLDACQTKLKEFMKTQKIGQMICGVCVKVCKGKI